VGQGVASWYWGGRCTEVRLMVQGVGNETGSGKLVVGREVY
jgi:hypothetical protein